MELTASNVRATSTKELIVAHGTIIVALETYLAPLLDFAVRFWLARVFFLSGLTKIQSWDSTLSLFESEYAVPLLPPELAAYWVRSPNCFSRFCWCLASGLASLRACCSCSTSSLWSRIRIWVKSV